GWALALVCCAPSGACITHGLSQPGSRERGDGAASELLLCTRSRAKVLRNLGGAGLRDRAPAARFTPSPQRRAAGASGPPRAAIRRSRSLIAPATMGGLVEMDSARAALRSHRQADPALKMQSQAPVVVVTQPGVGLAPQNSNWQTSMCDCFSDCGVCLCGTFCFPCLGCQVAADMNECCLCGTSVAMRTLYRTRYGIPISYYSTLAMPSGQYFWFLNFTKGNLLGSSRTWQAVSFLQDLQSPRGSSEKGKFKRGNQKLSIGGKTPQ
ncbi:hypothetical protein H8959_009252, partial [Pygathrix nigripes]